MRIAVSKIKQPRRKAQVIRRVRLTDLLHENIHRKLTFVCAPAGFGKTTLLTDFAEDIDAAICWYQIGTGESDLEPFFLYLVNAVQQVYPEFGQELAELVAQQGQPEPDALAIDFNNELIEHVTEFTVLILDDYHLASQSPEVVLFLEKLIALLPEQVKMLIGSRNVYGIPSAELFMKAELSTISAETLAFQTDELIDLARNYFQTRLEREQAQKIVDQTEGWIMGILVALRDKDLLGSIAQLSGTREDVFEFFYREIFQSLDPQLVDLLLVTSLFEEFDEGLCQVLLPDYPIDRLIRQLIDQNLFISQVEFEGETFYQYHQLFRSYLVEQCRQSLPAARIQQLQIDGAIYLAAQRAIEPAIDLMLDAGDIESAVKLMNQHAADLYVAGQHATLQRWVSAVSESGDVDAVAPVLLLNYAKGISSQGRNEETLELYQNLETVFRQAEDKANLVNLLVNKGILLSFMNHNEEAMQHGKEALDLIQDHHIDPFYAHQAERLIGLSACLLDDERDGLDWLDRAASGVRSMLRKNREYRYSHELVQTLADIGYFALNSGDIFRAKAAYDEAVQVAKSIVGHQGDLALALNNQAYVLHMAGEYKESWNKYELAVEAAQASGYKRVNVGILNGRGDLLRELGILPQAEEEYLAATSLRDILTPDFTLDRAYRGLAEIARERGEFNKANAFVREAAQWERADLSKTIYQILQAHIWLAMGQVELATGQLEHVLAKLDQQAYSIQRAFAYFLRGTISLDQHNSEEATGFFKKSLQDAAQLGYDQFLFQLVREHLAPFRKYLKAEQNPLPQLKDLLSRVTTAPTDLAQLIDREASSATLRQVQMLQIQGFRHGQVRINGERIPDANWKSSNARALFFYILESGGVTKEQIALEFWPDFSTGKVNSNFHATLWRARNALGSRDLIEFDGDKYIIPATAIADYDLWRFRELLDRLSIPGISDQDFRNLAYQLHDIYQGDFLGDIDMPWIDERRMDLDQQYHRELERLARVEYELGHFDQARRLYETLIERDPYNEAHHSGYLATLVALQERSAAKQHYEQYASELDAQMGLQPGEELQEIYQNL